MAIRKRTVKHVFGTLKYRMGSAHFSMRHMPHVAAEMSLHVLAHNLKRVISILGIAKNDESDEIDGRLNPSSLCARAANASGLPRTAYRRQ